MGLLFLCLAIRKLYYWLWNVFMRDTYLCTLFSAILGNLKNTTNFYKHSKRNCSCFLSLHFPVKVAERDKMMLTVPAKISHLDAVILQAAIPSNARNSDQDDLLMIHLLLDKYGNKYQQLQNCWLLTLTDDI